MRQAETHAQWESAAIQLDSLDGNDVWKENSADGDYNSELLEERLEQLNEARTSGDVSAMMYLIRTALSRDLGGMDNVDLYRHSYVGTKKLIERYVESTIATIEAVVTQAHYKSSVEHRDLLEGMLYARQSFGRSALLLSGGGTFGMAHIGVLKSLFEAKLMPRIISGASAGSIVCAVTCTKTDEELPEVLKQFPYGDLAVFEAQESKEGVLDRLRRLLTEGSWSDISHLTRVMRDLTGDMTFQEAYNRTRRILNIGVSTTSTYDMPRLLNYVTAPNVMIWSAVAASCSVPVVFNASPLLIKDPLTGEHRPWNLTPERWIDGSVENDLPMTRLSEMFNVNHFIVSQVNPHVVPFLARDDHLSPDEKLEAAKLRGEDESHWLNTITTLAKEEALHRLHFLAEMGIFPTLATKFRSILSQKYSGDITILPEVSLHELPKLLTNPTSDFMVRMGVSGERATWPKLSRIRDRCAIEMALDHAVHQLRTRVVFSESQQDLRKFQSSISSTHVLETSLGPFQPAAVHDVSDIIAGVPRRHRRRSGGCLQSLPDRRRIVSESQQSLARGGASKPSDDANASPVGSKPTLKRASKSHIHMAQHRRHLTAPALPDGVLNLSRSWKVNATNKSAKPINETNDDEQRWATSEPWLASNPTQTVHLSTPIYDMETSEDADGPDPRTDDSELDNWDDQSRTSPETNATKVDGDQDGHVSPTAHGARFFLP
jgi:TAG lipase/steryl ester hydrolase/phospholipase A2/LPA acyltransferase